MEINNMEVAPDNNNSNTFSFHVKASRAKSLKQVNIYQESECSLAGDKQHQNTNSSIDKIKRKKTVFKVGTEDHLLEIFNAGKANERKKRFDKSALDKQCLRLQKYLKMNMRYFVKKDEEDENSGIDEFENIKKGSRSAASSPVKSIDLVPSRRAESNDVDQHRVFFANKLKYSVVKNHFHINLNNDINVKNKVGLNSPERKDHFDFLKNFNEEQLYNRNSSRIGHDNSLMDPNASSALMLINDDSFSLKKKEDKNKYKIVIPRKHIHLNATTPKKGKKTVSFLYSKPNHNQTKPPFIDGENKFTKFQAKNYLNIINTESLFKNSEYTDEDFVDKRDKRNSKASNKSSDRKSVTLKEIPRIDALASGDKLKGLKKTVLARLTQNKISSTSSAKNLSVKLKFSHSNLKENEKEEENKDIQKNEGNHSTYSSEDES